MLLDKEISISNSCEPIQSIVQALENSAFTARVLIEQRSISIELADVNSIYILETHFQDGSTQIHQVVIVQMRAYLKVIAVFFLIAVLHGQTFSQEISARFGLDLSTEKVAYNDTIGLDHEIGDILAISYGDTLSSRSDYCIGLGNYSRRVFVTVASPERGFFEIWSGDYISPMLGVRHWFKTRRKGVYVDLEVMPCILVSSSNPFIEDLEFSSILVLASARIGYRLVLGRRLSVTVSTGLAYRFGDILLNAENPNSLVQGSVFEATYHF